LLSPDWCPADSAEVCSLGFGALHELVCFDYIPFRSLFRVSGFAVGFENESPEDYYESLTPGSSSYLGKLRPNAPPPLTVHFKTYKNIHLSVGNRPLHDISSPTEDFLLRPPFYESLKNSLS